jgi:hypothetical protein
MFIMVYVKMRFIYNLTCQMSLLYNLTCQMNLLYNLICKLLILSEARVDNRVMLVILYCVMYLL